MIMMLATPIAPTSSAIGAEAEEQAVEGALGVGFGDRAWRRAG